jgi:hypothetical protein
MFDPEGGCMAIIHLYFVTACAQFQRLLPSTTLLDSPSMTGITLFLLKEMRDQWQDSRLLSHGHVFQRSEDLRIVLLTQLGGIRQSQKSRMSLKLHLWCSG